MNRLKNLVAIVTGGGSGFGEAICHHYTSQGAKVMVADLDEAKAAKVAGAVNAAGREAASCRVDVASNADMKAMVAATLERFPARSGGALPAGGKPSNR